MTKTAKWIVVSGVLAALTVGGTVAYVRHAREARWHEEAVAALPARPVTLVHPELINRVETAEEQVRAEFNWRGGLGSLASLYHANGATQEAATLYGVLVRADAENAHWPDRLASVYSLYGQLDQAVLLWRRTAQIDPHYLPAQLNLADALIKMNRAPEAVPIYDAVLKVDPQNPYAVAGLAKADIAAGRWQEARSRLENVGLSSGVNIGENILVSVYEHLGDADKARAMRSRAKSTDSYIETPDPWLDEVSDDCYDAFRLTWDSGAARRRSDLPRALRLLEKAIRVNPTYALAYFQMGILQVDLHDREAAKKAFRRSIDLDPTFGDAWAKLIALSRSREEADRALAEGLRRCPDSPSLHAMNGKRLKALGQLDEALEEFKRVAELRPSEILGLIDCAQIYFQRGQDAVGVQTLQRALEILPEDPLVLSTLAIYWIGAKNEPKAHEFVLRCRAQVRLQEDHVLKIVNAYQAAFGRSP